MHKSLTTELTAPLVSPLTLEAPSESTRKKEWFEPLVQDEAARQSARQNRHVEADTED